MIKTPLIGILATIAIVSVNLFGDEVPCRGDPPESRGIGEETWTKHPGNPILPSGPTGSWNNFKTDPTVVKDGDVYQMWYGTNRDGTLTKIGHATSEDGMNWRLDPEPVLEPGPPGSWEGTDVETPTVIIDNEAPPEERYKMWYSGWIVDQETYRIGYATSPDGLHWTKYEGNPVLDVGHKENYDWDGWSVTDPTVIKRHGVYEMWYSGVGEVPEEGSWHFWIGYASSEDGIHWKKYSGNPVLNIGPANSFESRAVGQPAVLFDGAVYQMWYSGWDEIDTTWSSEIGYATSPDGVHWTKSPTNPILMKGRAGAWDSQQVVSPTVLRDEGYKMWYTGMKLVKIRGRVVNLKVGIGYATSQKE